MNNEQYIKYNRHLILPEIGVAGQEKLLKSRILIVGIGGLGSPASIYLVAAGVGNIGLVEFDTVDLSNLQRQILYDASQVGSSKLEIATERLKSINPEVNITKHNGPLTSSNALHILKDYDYIVDATDNFATRYLINDACVLLDKTYVFGSIYNFEGQITIFGAKNGPCLRCLFPSSPEPEDIPSSLDLGVLGMLPGIIGIIQAIEIIKLICKIGDSLIGRLIFYDILTMRLREVKIAKNPDCPVCGENPTIKTLNGYEKICNSEPELEEINIISTLELYRKLKCQDSILILDIREPCEYKNINFEHSIQIPINNLLDRLEEIKEYQNKKIIVLCQTGILSISAAKTLYARGFKSISVLDGGVSSWRLKKDYL